MPFLDWVNKNQAVNSAAEVPYHLLHCESVHGDTSSHRPLGMSGVRELHDNLLIQGDNLKGNRFIASGSGRISPKRW